MKQYSNTGWLRVGLIVDLDGEGPCEVVLVNDCRAACVPLRKRSVTINREGEAPKKFEASRARVNISPRSEVRVLARNRDDYNRTRPRDDDGVRPTGD